MKKSLKLALLVSMASALPLAAIASHASAQSYSRLVAFGDSLTDNGNLFIATSGTQPPAPYNKRFTNELTFAEYLAGPLQGFFTATSYTSGNIDLAFGGARSDLAANSNGPIPGTPAQLASYLGHGGTFGPNDVASMWAGANDIFQGLPTAAANPSTAAAYMTGVATTAATNVSTQVGQLATVGAKTIIVMNLPDLGSTPQFNTDPTTSALTSYTAGVYNTALDTGLKAAAAAHTSSNIIEVDVKSAFTAIIANPAAFGFANVTQACVAVTSCVTAANATRDTYLFWDGVHPTAGGHQLVAKLAAQYLYTQTLSAGVGAFADQAYAIRQSNQDDVSVFLHKSQGSEGDGGVYASAIGANGSRDRSLSSQSTIGGVSVTQSVKAYDYRMGGMRAGAIQNIGGNTTWGFGVTALTGDSKAFLVTGKSTDISVDAGFDYRPGNMFFTGAVGGSLGSVSDYKRQTLISGFQEHFNQIDTNAYSASLQVGLDHKSGDWTVAPVARLSYDAATMKGFNELGVVAAVGYQDRKVSALSGAAELRVSGNLSQSVKMNGLLGYEAVLSGTEDSLKGQLINNTAQPFATDMGKVGSPGLLVGLGLESNLGGLTLSAQYRGSFGSNKQTDQTGMIAFKKAF